MLGFESCGTGRRPSSRTASQIEFGPVGGPYQTSDAGTGATYMQNGISVGVQYEARVRAYEY